MAGFTVKEALPGVFHIRDALGVFMTLIVGSRRALLVDTGYGFDDVAACVKGLTDKPVSVLLTHAHHDHALGAMWFDRTHMFDADSGAFTLYTCRERRIRTAQQAAAAGLAVPPAYLDAPIPAPLPAREETVDLGGISAEIRLCPGHTPGSAVVYIPERKLLLTGDDWNPCTWLFFPEALPMERYRENVRALLALDFAHVLCSHREALYPRSEMEAFLSGLTDERLRAAVKVSMGWPIDTREAEPAPGRQFVFDFGKTSLSAKEENA